MRDKPGETGPYMSHLRTIAGSSVTAAVCYTSDARLGWNGATVLTWHGRWSPVDASDGRSEVRFLRRTLMTVHAMPDDGNVAAGGLAEALHCLVGEACAQAGKVQNVTIDLGFK